MELNDTRKYGLIVWGTKRGKVIFFTLNIATDFADLPLEMKDPRQDINLSLCSLGTCLYGIGHGQQYSTLTLYRAIRDWIDRTGFYAISLVIARDQAFQENTVKSLLDRLSQNYWENNIKPSSLEGQIVGTPNEDPRWFQQQLELPENRLERTTCLPPSGDQRVYLIYNNPEEAAGILDNFRLDEFMQSDTVFLIPAESSIVPLSSISRIDTPTLPQKLELTVRLLYQNTQTPAEGVRVEVHKNRQLVEEELCSKGQWQLKGKLTPADRDKLYIVVSKQGYYDETAQVSELFRQAEPDADDPAKRTAKVYLELKPVPVKVNNGNHSNTSNPKPALPVKSPAPAGGQAAQQPSAGPDKPQKTITFRDFVRSNMQAILICSIFFVIVFMGTRMLLGGSGKITKGDSLTVAESYDFTNDQTALEDDYKNYLADNSYINKLSDDENHYFNVRAHFAATDRKIQDMKKNHHSVADSWFEFYDKQSKSLDSLHNLRESYHPHQQTQHTGSDGAVTPHTNKETSNNNKEQDILAWLNAGIDAGPLKQKQQYLKLAAKAGAPNYQNPEIKSKLNKLNAQIENLKNQ